MRVLFVDDDPQLLELLEAYAMSLGYDFRTAISGEKALGIAKVERFDAAVIDIALGGENGFQTARDLIDLNPDAAPKIVIMSSRDVKQERGRARIAGASAVIQKPFTQEDLASAIRLVTGE